MLKTQNWILLTCDSPLIVSHMMDTLHWDKLCERWNKQILNIIVFKCLKNDAPSYLSSNFIFTSSIHSQGTRSQSFNTLVLPSWYNNSDKCAFQYSTSKWNTLLSDIRSNLTSMNLNMFKSYISNSWISCNHSCILFTHIGLFFFICLHVVSVCC